MKLVLTLFSMCMPFMALAQPSTQQEAVNFISFSEGKVLGLAETFTDEQLGWSPAEGVRSTSEVLLHIASGNYFFMSACGFALPEGLDPGTLDETVKGKANIISTVSDSYAFVKESILNIANAQLGDKVEFPFPGEYTKLSAVMLSVDHTSEHLGQLIAYARMNGVTPPWSQGGN